MRRWILVISALLAAGTLWAHPARPGGVKYVQPDGSVLEIYLHGDEWGHWVTDREGHLLDLDANGFYRLSVRSLPRVRRQMAEQRSVMRSRMAMARDAAGSYERTRGTHRIPVILIEFADCSFRVSAPKTAFSNMLSQRGYDVAGATGSVWDYFNDNSHGQYFPVFDVYGPVTLSKNMASYGGNSADTGRDIFPGPELALVDAALMLDETVDFSRYDEDGDGMVDMVLFYFAGYDEAEGGPADAIWSHQWNVQSSSSAKARNTLLDDVKLGSYICTSELQGNSGIRMGGIGSTVHEFSHHLGLPDFYDVDDEENGRATGLYTFSTMCYGMYNNFGNTPPFFNAEELRMLGWLQEDDIPELPDGEVSLPGIQNGKAYTIPSGMAGEYFLVECRDGSAWDAPLPQGLAVYHVDKSDRIVSDGVTASTMWRYWRYYNNINNFGSHPCFYIIPSSAPASFNFNEGNDGVLFPGSKNVTAFQPVDWDGRPTVTQLTAIRYANGTASFTARSNAGKSINGLVVNTSGEPLQDVTVKVEPDGPSGLTDWSGNFYIGLSSYQGESNITVSFSMPGYIEKSLVVTLEKTGNNLFVMLRKEGEAQVFTLDKQNPQAELASYSSKGKSQMGAVRFTADELAPYVGQRLSTVTFYPVGYGADAVLVLVESGGQRLLSHRVPNPVFMGWNSVDISEYDLRVPAGEDLYIGYAVKGCDYDYPLSCRLSSREDPTESYYAVYSDTPVSWQPMRKYDLAVSATVSEVKVPTALADIGYHCIDAGSGVYSAGDSFPLRLKEAPSRLPDAVTWYFDGAPVSGTSVTLQSGLHTVEARLGYANGSAEVLELEIEVE